MEIIKHGEIYKKIKCKCCNCEFLITKKDIKIDLVSYYEFIICPECNYKNKLYDI